MDDDESDRSEGSDIDVDYDVESKQIDDLPDRLSSEQLQQDGEGETSEEDSAEASVLWKRAGFSGRSTESFKRKPGLKKSLPPNASPLDSFSHLFNDAVWNRLVEETNRYADQQGAPARWAPTDQQEMKTFIGLCLAMGLHPLPDRRSHWRQTKWLYTTPFHRAMARDRFDSIWRFLHLEDNQAPVDRNDKLWKMRWLLSHLSQNFQALYEVNGKTTVDESMVKFKGRLSFRQYLPMKPTKWGIKVWVMAESTTGYVVNFQVYTGREGRQERGLAYRVVMDLATPYFGSDLQIFMDNFFSGTDLFQDLKAQQIQACGTVRANRKGLPSKIIPKKGSKKTMSRHQFKVAQKEELTFCVWQDTKAVMVLSNFHDPTHRGHVTRRGADSSRVRVEVPSALADYQQHMRGVDLLDQMISYNSFDHRSRKWWRRIFFFMLNVSCYNAFVASRNQREASTLTSSSKKRYREWLEDLSMQLVTPSTKRSTPQPAQLARSVPEHDCEKLYSKRKTCRECALSRTCSDARASATTYGCKQCNEALHVECFGKHIRRHLSAGPLQ